MAKPRASAGYSGTPLPKKLGIKPGHTVVLIRAPQEFAETLGSLPERVALRGEVSARLLADVVVLFVRSRGELEKRFGLVAKGLKPEGSLWVAWPKKTSSVETDLTEDVLREVCLPTGYVDTKVCAIDDTWSALRFVLRTESRPA